MSVAAKKSLPVIAGANHEINRAAARLRLFARLLIGEQTQVKQSKSHQVRRRRGQLQARAANRTHSLQQFDLGRSSVQPNPARKTAEMPPRHHEVSLWCWSAARASNLAEPAPS